MAADNVTNLKPDSSREGIDLHGNNATPIPRFYGGRTDYATAPQARPINDFEQSDRNIARKDAGMTKTGSMK